MEKQVLQEQIQNGAVDPDLLFEAFEVFNQTSAALERSYADLQKKVSELNLELEEKNRKLERNLLEKQELSAHLETVLSGMRDAVIAYDLDGRITLANRAAENLLGKQTAELEGRSLDEVCVSVFGFIPLSDKDPQGTGEIHLKREEETLVFQIARHGLEGADGRQIGGLITLEDITRTTFARQQAERNERLAAMGKMAVNIVHEIRNPMGSIELMASLLRRDLAADPPKREIAEKISSGIHSLNHIIENLLIFARDRKPHFASIDLHRLADEACDAVMPVAMRDRVEITKEYDDDARRLVGDKDLLKQALLNIMLNAIQAMEGGGDLRIALSRRDLTDFATGRPTRFYQVRIADTGAGMSAETKARIFDPFFTTREKGTGLGLALVHKILGAHGGFIGVDSTPGQGTIFTLMLPSRPPKENEND